MADIIQVHGYGFVFSGSFIRIDPRQFLVFLDQTPSIRQKVQEKAPCFLKKIKEMKSTDESSAEEEGKLDDLLADYAEDSTGCCGLAALYVDTVNEITEIGIDIQRDDEDGNIVMLIDAAPWEYTPKQLQLKSAKDLSVLLKECCDKSGIICDTAVDFVTAEAWG